MKQKLKLKFVKLRSKKLRSYCMSSLWLGIRGYKFENTVFDCWLNLLMGNQWIQTWTVLMKGIRVCLGLCSSNLCCSGVNRISLVRKLRERNQRHRYEPCLLKSWGATFKYWYKFTINLTLFLFIIILMKCSRYCLIIIAINLYITL